MTQSRAKLVNYRAMARRAWRHHCLCFKRNVHSWSRKLKSIQCADDNWSAEHFGASGGRDLRSRKY